MARMNNCHWRKVALFSVFLEFMFKK
jgi:hypothetical protein